MNDPGRHIVVTGVGVISPLGSSADDLWCALMERRSALKEWPDLEAQLFRGIKACRIEGFESVPALRGRALALFAARRALEASGAFPTWRNIGLFVGSTIGDSYAFEEAKPADHRTLHEATCYGTGRYIKSELGISGIVRAYGAACAAGNYAIGAAAEYIRNGICDVALAGGVDPFSRIAMAGFSRSRAMSPTGECRPFDAARNGMVLGEGAAFFVLEREASARERGATILCALGSLGVSCDAYHPTAPRPGGEGMAAAMLLALQLSGLAPEQIDWICAHGSGTTVSDQAEARAINQIFGEKQPKVSAFKPAIGHSLGAATALEAAICIQSIQKQIIPPTLQTKNPDSALNVELVTEAIPVRINHIMNNGFAFGGLNSSMIISRYDPC